MMQEATGRIPYPLVVNNIERDEKIVFIVDDVPTTADVKKNYRIASYVLALTQTTGDGSRHWIPKRLIESIFYKNQKGMFSFEPGSLDEIIVTFNTITEMVESNAVHLVRHGEIVTLSSK